ncbi:MAG: DUF4251 domain-containing protein [Bacteroidota bacterium]
MKASFTTLAALLLILLTTACSSTRKTVATELEKARFERYAEDGVWELRAHWARPFARSSMNAIASAGLLPPGSTGTSISLTGNSAYLKIEKDSVFANLPYFGERQMISGFGTGDVGINFKGVPKDFQITFDEDKQWYNFTFSIKNEVGEHFTVNGQLLQNLRSRFTVRSSQRFSITYDAHIKEPAKSAASTQSIPSAP